MVKDETKKDETKKDETKGVIRPERFYGKFEDDFELVEEGDEDVKKETKKVVNVAPLGVNVSDGVGTKDKLV
jgi:hypothetical protein